MQDSISKPNDVWIIYRQDIETTQDGGCNVYFLLDAFSKFLLGIETSTEKPERHNVIALFKKARETSGEWPRQVWILKKDPFLDLFKTVCDELEQNLLTDVTAREMRPYVTELEKSFGQFKKGNLSDDNSGLSEDEAEELKTFIPETYAPCPCASGKKFKFCCQRVFKEITLAMCAAQEGDRKSALRHIQSAEAKVGRTAEIVCRLAICWSFFDVEKSQKYLQEALKINPNHPRSNYIMGLDAKQNGDFELAIKHYLRAIENYPVGDVFHLNETYNNLGNVYYELGKFKEAKQAWEKALVLLPKDKMTRENLVEFIYSNTDLPESVREMSPFIKKYWER